MMISKNPTSQEWCVFMGNITRVQVVSLGIIRSHLNIEKSLFFCKMWRSYPIRRNLIYVPILDRLGYNFLLELEKLIYIETLLIGNGALYENLY